LAETAQWKLKTIIAYLYYLTKNSIRLGLATKVFRTKDLCGQTYLAYHIDSTSQLRLVRYSSSNDQSHFIFGAVTQMQAKDAALLDVRCGTSSLVLCL